METNTAFTINLVVPEISKYDSEIQGPIQSSPHVAAGLSWTTSVETDRMKHDKYLSVYCECETTQESPHWSCNADVTFRLVSARRSHRFWKMNSVKFDIFSAKRGHPFFVSWRNMFAIWDEFTNNLSITIETEINVWRVRNVRNYSYFDTQDRHTDMTLILNENQTLYVSKVYLSIYSTVLREMFIEKADEKTITLDDNFEEFIDLLRIISPARKPIDKKNVKYIVNLAVKYNMKGIIDKCEEFLIKNNHVTAIEKLCYADQYSLQALKNYVIQSLTSISAIRQLQRSSDYSLLSEATKSVLYERIVQL